MKKHSLSQKAQRKKPSPPTVENVTFQQKNTVEPTKPESKRGRKPKLITQLQTDSKEVMEKEETPKEESTPKEEALLSTTTIWKCRHSTDCKNPPIWCYAAKCTMKKPCTCYQHRTPSMVYNWYEIKKQAEPYCEWKETQKLKNI